MDTIGRPVGLPLPYLEDDSLALRLIVDRGHGGRRLLLEEAIVVANTHQQEAAGGQLGPHVPDAQTEVLPSQEMGQGIVAGMTRSTYRRLRIEARKSATAKRADAPASSASRRAPCIACGLRSVPPHGIL